jgi:hypothetical protein
MIRSLLTVLTALALGLGLAVPAQAHRQKITITTIAHNPRTNLLEVVHSVPIHDAEHALRKQGARAPDIITDIESRRAFANYAASRFGLARGNTPIALTLLGSEIEGGNIVIYQEAPSPGSGIALVVRAEFLTDVFARQENRVNMGTGTDVETLVFQVGDPPKAGILP